MRSSSTGSLFAFVTVAFGLGVAAATAACSGGDGTAAPGQDGGSVEGLAPPSSGDGGAGGASSSGGSGGGSATCGDGVVAGDELCDGDAAVDCTTLGAIYGGGKATCRKDCSGYDVTACAPSAQRTETVHPSKRDPRWANAKCNDGSDFTFEVSMAPKPTSKWLVHLEGGGQCDGTYQTCVGRPVNLMSSTKQPADRQPGDVSNATFMNRDPAVNPDFWDANMVKANYCSSDLWVGTNLVPQTVKTKDGTAQIVFAGRYNVRALVGELFRSYGLDDATSELLFMGNSAGGAGAFTNVDLVAGRMPKAIADGRLALLVGSAYINGLWTDTTFTWAGKGKPDGAVIDDLAKTYGADVNTRCAANAVAAGRSPSTCIVGAFAYAAAAHPAPEGWGVRTFVAQNRLDQLELKDHLVPTADTTDPAAQQARATWLQQMTTSLDGVAWLYAPADPQDSAAELNLHGLLPDPSVWPFEPPGHPDQTLQAMVGRFWKARGTSGGERLLFDGEVPHKSEAAQ